MEPYQLGLVRLFVLDQITREIAWFSKTLVVLVCVCNFAGKIMIEELIK